METTSLQTKGTEIKKTWETPTITEIDKSVILAPTNGLATDSQNGNTSSGAAGGPTAS
jgi:hypothetical protein